MDTVAHDVMAADAIADGEVRLVAAGPWQLLLVRVAGAYYAINNRCSHAASPLETGRVRGSMIACPLHGARFDVTTGKCVGAAYPNIRTFPARLENGRVLVEVPTRAPDRSEVPISVRR